MVIIKAAIFGSDQQFTSIEEACSYAGVGFAPLSWQSENFAIGERIYYGSPSLCASRSSQGTYFALTYRTPIYIVYTPPTGKQIVYTISHNGSNYIIDNITTCETTIDGYTYPIITIGTQQWFSENLKTTKYRDNSTIPGGGNGAPNNLGYWYYVNGDSANTTSYGLLYDWYAVTGSTANVVPGNKLCPAGWHVPTDAEWTTLTTHLGGLSVAGGKMKSIGTTYWNSPNTGADNSSGFDGRGAGFKIRNEVITTFRNQLDYWSTTTATTTTSFVREITTNFANVNRFSVSNELGFSVRCIRN
jgi:uncharacterized protein (TIGR02145 family)